MSSEIMWAAYAKLNDDAVAMGDATAVAENAAKSAGCEGPV